MRDLLYLNIPRAEDLLCRLKVIENQLQAVGKVDLCRSFLTKTRNRVWYFCVWDYTDEGHHFWIGLADMLLLADGPDIDRVIAARKAVTKYLKEAGCAV